MKKINIAVCNLCGKEMIEKEMGEITECKAKNCPSKDIGYYEKEIKTNK